MGPARVRAAVGEPVGADVEQASGSTGKTAVSAMFIARTRTALGELMSSRLDDVRLAVMMLDGLEIADRTHVVALGITTEGVKVPLGLWEGSTENASSGSDGSTTTAWTSPSATSRHQSSSSFTSPARPSRVRSRATDPSRKPIQGPYEGSQRPGSKRPARLPAETALIPADHQIRPPPGSCSARPPGSLRSTPALISLRSHEPLPDPQNQVSVEPGPAQRSG